jgi:hypothetical protein
MRARSLCLALFLVWTPIAASAAGYLVTSTEDTATGGTLRQAILAANAGGVPTGISFNMAIGCSSGCRIQLASPLPPITVPLTIDGYTQPGASPNTLAVGDDAVINILLDVNNRSGDGLSFSSSAAGSVVRGLRITNFGDGIGSWSGIVSQANDVVIEGNFIDVPGLGFTPYGGVVIAGGSNVRVGGTAPAQRNVIQIVPVVIASSGPGTLIQGNYLGSTPNGLGVSGGGVQVQAYTSDIGDVTIGGTAAGAGNLIIGIVEVTATAGHAIGAMTIQGNKIGTNVTGTVAPFMGGGVRMQATAGGSIASSLIGGSIPSARNLISLGTTASYAGIYASGVSALTIQGNYIGCNAAGTATLGSGDWAVSVDGGNSFFGTVQVGGSGPGEGNLLTGGALGGVRVGWTTATIEGNFIGVGLDGKTPLSNTVGILVDSADASIGGTSAAQRNVIAKNYSDGVQVDISMPAIHNAAKATVLGNSIFDNGRLGIYFVGTGQVPLPNDPGDGDTGPNGFQNYPILTSAAIQGGQVFISGTLDSMPDTLYRIEWFANTACDPSGYGEGRLPLGGSSYMTDGSGHATFIGVMRPIPIGYPIITATATDPAGNTSEFSACFTATGPPESFFTVPPCRLSDTRNANGPYGGPSFVATEQRSYVVAGQCGVPSNALSVSLNVAVTAPSGVGNLVLIPAGAALPTTSAINYGVGRTRSNNAIVPLGPDGDLTVFANQAAGNVHVIIDVTGYFQ